MKKSFLVLTAALTFGTMAGAQTAATVSAPQVPAMTDVPAGHWAKDAIDRLIGKGIILGYPDGTFRGTQNLTRYEAAVIIARLLDQMKTDGTPSSMNADDVTALQNAVQELAADLAALGVRVSDLEENAVNKDDFARLEARIEEVAAANGDTAATADLKSQIDALSARTDDLTARADDYDTMRADVDDNASSIAALNDLTVLLNQDILDLQDRVSATEAAQADFVQRSDFDALNGKVTGLDGRVAKLESAPKFTVSGSINGTYGRLNYTRGSTAFDISRLVYGTFQAGILDSNGTGKDGSGEMPYDYTADATGVRLGIGVSGLTTANGTVVVNSAQVNLRTANAWNILGKVGTGITVAEPYVYVNDGNASGLIDGQAFTVKYDRRYADFKFQNYLFDNADADAIRRGLVATIDATKLPFSPKLTLVTGSTNSTAATTPGMLAVGQAAPANYWGVSSKFTIGDGGKLAINYGQVDNNRAAAGLDLDAKFGVVALKGESVISVPSNDPNAISADGSLQHAWNYADKMGYLEGRVDLGVVKFGANYRAIDPQFTSNAEGSATMSSQDDRPYVADQIGYGAALATNLGPATLGAYVDRRTNWAAANPVFGVGGKLGAKLGSFQAVGFYNMLQVNGAQADGIFMGYNPQLPDAKNVPTIDDHWLPGSSTDYNVNSVGTGMGLTKVPFEMTSTFGGEISHDGGAADALVKNLNFTVGDGYYYTSKTNSLYAYGDYTLAAGGFTVKPLFRVHSVMNSSISDDLHNLTVLKGGLKVSSPVLTQVPLQPSLFANVVGRSSTGKVTNTKTSEVLGQVGVGFNRLFADNLTGNVGYSYYTGKNVTTLNTAFDDSDPFSTSLDRVYGAGIAPAAFNGTTPIFNPNGVKVTGIFGQLAWNSLVANWGVFHNQTQQYDYTTQKTTSTDTVAQGFKVNYTFRF